MARKRISCSYSHLPTELLSKIFETLREHDDLFVSASVCLSWRSVVGTLYPHLQPYFQILSKTERPILPPLLLLSETEGKRSNQKSYVLYPFLSSKIEIDLPELEGRWFSSSSYGWLLTIGFNATQNIYLLNPITREQIKLPIPAIEFARLQYMRVITSTKPRHPNCIFLARTTVDSHTNLLDIANYFCKKLAICRPGDETWTIVEFFRFCSDTIYYKGKFYVVDFLGHIHRINLGSFSITIEELPIEPAKLEFMDNYLVEWKGDMFLVQRLTISIPDPFKIYKLDWQRKRWIPTENIVNYAILLGKSTSRIVAVNGDLKSNCIYFIDDAEATKIIYDGAKVLGNMGVYNIVTKQFESIAWFSKLRFRTPGLNWLN